MMSENNFRNLESMGRTVRRANNAKEFALVFAECNSPKEQEKYVEKLRRMCAEHDIIVTEVKLNKSPVKRLLPVIKEHLEKEFKNGLPGRLGIQVTGFELSILLDEDEEWPAVLQILNMNRESYYTDLPFPLIFWLPEYACTKVANAAPDFWSFGVGSHTFFTGETTRDILPADMEDSKDINDWQDKQSQIPLLEGLLDTGQSPGVLVDLLMKLGEAHAYTRETEKARHEYEQAIRENEKVNGDPQRVAEAYNKLGIIYSNLGFDKKLLDRAVKSLERYLEIAKQGYRTEPVVVAYNHLGRVYHKHMKHSKALQFYEKALEFSRRHGHRKLEGDVLENMGQLYRKLRMYDDGLRMHNQALIIGRESDDIRREALNLNNIGRIYYEWGEYRKAVDYLNNALLYSKKTGNQKIEMEQSINLGDAWKALGDFSLALEKYLYAKTIAEKINVDAFIIECYEKLAELYEVLAEEKELNSCRAKLEKLNRRQIIFWFEPGAVEMKDEDKVPVLQVGKTYSLNFQIARTPHKHPPVYQGKITSFKEPQKQSNITGIQSFVHPGKEDYSLSGQQGGSDEIRSPAPPPYLSTPDANSVSFHFEGPKIAFDQSDLDVLLSKNNISDVRRVTVTPQSAGNYGISVRVRVERYGYKSDFDIPFRVISKKN